MSKILKNQTASPIVISDAGATIPVLPATFTIPPQDYLIWAASSDIITAIGSGDVVVNDGSFDLSISDGTDLIKGIFPTTVTVTGSTLTPLPIDFNLTQKDTLNNNITSSPQTIWEGHFRQSKEEEYWDEDVISGASSTHLPLLTSVRLSVGTTIGSKAIRQTYRHFHCVKGNSTRVYLTGNFKGLKTGVRKRYGQFNAYNGLFFESNGLDIRVVVRSDTSGSVVDNVISSSNWNLDKLDGTGPSGQMANPEMQQLFFIDYAWLGSGPIRFGIFIGSTPVFVHQIDSSNNIATPWSRSADLPIRCELENLTTQAEGSDFHQTNVSIKSYGGNRPDGNIKSVDAGATAVSVSTTNKVVAGIRLSSGGVRGASITPMLFAITPASGSSMLYYQILLRPNLTGATWTTFSSITDVLTNNPTYSGGILLQSGYLSLGSQGGGNNERPSTSSGVTSDKVLGYDTGEQGDALILVVRTISSTGSILFTGTFEELS